MDILVIYAITAGSVLVSLVAFRLLRLLSQWKSPILVLLSRHIIYPHVVARHRFLGPWSRLSVLTHLAYATVNSILVFFLNFSLENVSRRAGDLSLINMIFLLTSSHLSYSADLLGIPLRTYRQMHRASGWMAMALVVLHVGALVFNRKDGITRSDGQTLFPVIATACLAALSLIFLPFVRKFSYELSLRVHQALTIVSVYGIWKHLPQDKLLPRLYLYIGLSVFTGTSCLPVNVRAGQYVNLWLPGVSFWSWTQTHPFTVVSWSQGKQSELEFLVQPRSGLTATIARQMRVIGPDGYSCLALYSGPHGLSESVNNYETVLLIAGGAGLPAVIPYAKRLIYGYNTCTSHVRRVHLVWQAETREQLNDLLKEDVLDDGYILSISIYVEQGPPVREKLLFGKHERATLYQGAPDYATVVSTELSREKIEKLSPIRDNQGQVLLIVSAPGVLRDELRHIVRGHLHQRIKMVELEYQP
ncbi:hypothetical protein AN9023.2 [Aspergillus nidulans FGSC A4]|nr:hypothetical protein AN9023.2 [Aspergillus nidulans FGSC A4]|eukprot:XP_682292.1 hypothetical protein AN9023.2 [Aspergillus nidulans FGSC A4]